MCLSLANSLDTYRNQVQEFVAYLKCKLSSGSQDNSLDASLSEELIFPKIFDQRQCKTKGLARACQISRNNIFPVENRVEAVLLDRKQAIDSTSLQFLNCLSWDFRIVLELSIFDCVLLQHSIMGLLLPL